MNIKLTSVLAISSLIMFACGDAAQETSMDETTENAVATEMTYNADLSSSMVNWRGEVAGVYGHEGFVNFKSGTIMTQDNKLTGGEFVIDMSMIYPTDSASFKDEDGSRITDFQGHLTTEDFFATEMYPTAKFVITKVEGDMVTGNLTIRDKTNEETIQVSNMEMTENGMTASGSLTFDRQKYDVAWVHFMKDMVLSDDINLTFTFVANKG